MTQEEAYMLSLVGMARYCEKRKEKKTGRRTEMEMGMKKGSDKDHLSEPP